MKSGLPEEGEIVLCKVKKVLFHSVFVELVEYGNKEAMIHISEIAPGRIRNIRDYVKEDKIVVCKVLTVDKERGTIDLSLRRVSLQQRLKKEEEFKQEQKAEKILELVAQRLNTTLQEAYEKAGKRIIEEYGSLSSCFEDVALKGDSVLRELRLPEQYIKELVEVVRERIKPPEVTIVGELILESFAENGIEQIKSALNAGEKLAKANKYNMSLTYISAPRYMLQLKAADYKTAEDAVSKVTEKIISELKKSGGNASFERKK